MQLWKNNKQFKLKTMYILMVIVAGLIGGAIYWLGNKIHNKYDQ